VSQSSRFSRFLSTLSAEQSPMAGIILKVVSVAASLCMSALLKGSGDVPPGELVFFRSFFAVVPIIIFLVARGELGAGIRTRRPFDHIARGVVGTASMGCSFFALTQLPLPEAITINYATPLLIVVFGAVFLGEVVRLYRWSAVLVGLCGVAVIVGPELMALGGPHEAGPDQTLGVIAALISTVFGAFATLQVRRLVRTERSATVVLFFSLFAATLALTTIPFGWIMPSPAQAAMLFGAGIAGGIAQILMNEAYKRAEMSVVAPFEYTSLVLSIIVGYLAFAEIPTWSTILGGVIVTFAGIYIILRERQLGLKRVGARRFQPLQG
jgi:drug/metabolite transporter (DMT)-like permease